jgi:hypothetical protein
MPIYSEHIFAIISRRFSRCGAGMIRRMVGARQVSDLV